MVNLAIIGTASQLDLHQEALGTLVGVRLLTQGNTKDLIAQKKVDGLVFLDIDDKPYWIEVALMAGIHVIATHPIHKDLRHIENLYMRNDLAHLCILSQGKSSKFSDILYPKKPLNHCVSFFKFELDIDSALSPVRREDMQDQANLDLCDALLNAWGPVDTLFSRMRNLFHFGPMEDLAIVLLRMRNGVEGAIELLDFPGSKPKFSVKICTNDTLIDRSWEWSFEKNDLFVHYQNFVDCIRGQARPLLGVEGIQASYRLLEWMRQSARSDSIRYCRRT